MRSCLRVGGWGCAVAAVLDRHATTTVVKNNESGTVPFLNAHNTTINISAVVPGESGELTATEVLQELKDIPGYEPLFYFYWLNGRYTALKLSRDIVTWFHVEDYFVDFVVLHLFNAYRLPLWPLRLQQGRLTGFGEVTCGAF